MKMSEFVWLNPFMHETTFSIFRKGEFIGDYNGHCIPFQYRNKTITEWYMSGDHNFTIIVELDF